MASRLKQPHGFMLPKAPLRQHEVEKERRFIDEKHLAFVRTLPCLGCGGDRAGVAHHIQMLRSRGGIKEGDDVVVPLHGKCHNDFPGSLHVITEPKYWNARGIDPFAMAKILFEYSGDRERCIAEVLAARAAGMVRVRMGIKLYTEKR